MRQVIGLSIALVVALVASYVTWTDEGEELDDTEVAMYRAEPDDISSITWDSDDSTTTITRRSDDAGEYYEVDSVTRKEKRIPIAEPVDDEASDDEDEASDDVDEASDDVDEAPDDDVHGDGDPHDHGDDESEDDDEADKEPTVRIEIEETTSHFVGNDQAATLWEDFAPLMALRELVVDDDTDTTVFGLDEPTATITVKRDDKDLELVVGAETYGSKDLYVGYGERVFLVDNKVLKPLEQAAQRLVERTLQPIIEAEAKSLDLSWPDGTTRSWSHVAKAWGDAEQARKGQVWASTEAPDEADETAATWIDKLMRLRLKDYLSEEETAALELTEVFEVTVHGQEDDDTWTYTVLEGADEEGETVWYARSAYNRGTVLLVTSLARNVVDDLGNLRP